MCLRVLVLQEEFRVLMGLQADLWSVQSKQFQGIVGRRLGGFCKSPGVAGRVFDVFYGEE